MRISNILTITVGLMFLVACSNDSKKDTSKPEAKKTDMHTDSIQPTILFLGNSLTAGYGLSIEQAFPSLIQQKIDSLGWNYRCVNAGVSGETTAGGRDRIDWLLENTDHIYLVVVSLGGNDGLRAIDPESTQANLQGIIDAVRAYDPKIKIVVTGMEAPPNLGEDYTSAFRAVYPALAKENDITLMPFLLKDVAGEPNLNQADGIHPTPQGQRILARNLWEVMKPLLE